MYLMKKAFSIASAMVFLALLLATGIGLTHPANACPNTPSGTAGMNGNPTSPSSPRYSNSTTVTTFAVSVSLS